MKGKEVLLNFFQKLFKKLLYLFEMGENLKYSLKLGHVEFVEMKEGFYVSNIILSFILNARLLHHWHSFHSRGYCPAQGSHRWNIVLVRRWVCWPPDAMSRSHWKRRKWLAQQPANSQGPEFDFPRAAVHSLLLFEAIDRHWQNYKKTLAGSPLKYSICWHLKAIFYISVSITIIVTS